MKHQAVNPVLPPFEYIPDVEPYVFLGRLYLYGSHDRFAGTAFCQNDYVCWSAPVTDLGDWRFEGTIYRKAQDPRCTEQSCMYAPDLALGPDGRFYLYYTLDMSGTMAVAVADTPTGPFQYYGRVHFADGRVLGDAPEDIYQFDPGVLVDDDGRVYLYTGFGPHGDEALMRERFGKHDISGAFCIELEPDMLTVKSAPHRIAPQFTCAEGTSFAAHPFFEASSIRKIASRYYFIYSSSQGHELCYAVSRYPDRDFTFGGVLISNGDIGLAHWSVDHAANYIGNNHGGMVEVNGQWYIFYHRQTNYHSFSRQCCAEKLTVLPDGSILQAEMTSCGLNEGDLAGRGRYSAALACQLYAKDGACYSERAGYFRSLHPAFTQTGSDREADADQYITNMKDGASAVFKFFDLSRTSSICVEARGTGRLLVYGAPGRTLLAEVPVGNGQSPAVPLHGVSHSALCFVAETEGAIDFLSFTLE